MDNALKELNEAQKIAWQTEAFDATLEIAERWASRMHPDNSYNRMLQTRSAIKDDMGSDKLGRWLGWWQAVVSMSGACTMDDFRVMNKNTKEKYQNA